MYVLSSDPERFASRATPSIPPNEPSFLPILYTLIILSFLYRISIPSSGRPRERERGKRLEGWRETPRARRRSGRTRSNGKRSFALIWIDNLPRQHIKDRMEHIPEPMDQKLMVVNISDEHVHARRQIQMRMWGLCLRKMASRVRILFPASVASSQFSSIIHR